MWLMQIVKQFNESSSNIIAVENTMKQFETLKEAKIKWVYTLGITICIMYNTPISFTTAKTGIVHNGN